LNPTKPLNAAGIRIDPAVSVPKEIGTIPSPTETAAPEEDPPGIQFELCTFFGVQ